MAFERTEDLRIVREAEDIADKIWDEIINWNHFVKDTIGKQLVKSADSIGANIVESQGRFHPKDVTNFLYMSRGSLSEVKYWLRRSAKRQLLSKEKYEEFIDKIDNLAPQLNAFINVQKKRKS
ncbi:MAG TPA: four helix bundle protein [Elusimicrobia bacterium]|nr:four helix bundle protein [Elusimicrobiota bacterium]